MNLIPIPAEQTKKTSQLALAFLDSPSASVPGNLVEGIVSCKSMLRGLIAGTLVVCQVGPDDDSRKQEQPSEPDISKGAT